MALHSHINERDQREVSLWLTIGEDLKVRHTSTILNHHSTLNHRHPLHRKPSQCEDVTWNNMMHSVLWDRTSQLAIPS